jgi:hypothetical protein
MQRFEPSRPEPRHRPASENKADQLTGIFAGKVLTNLPKHPRPRLWLGFLFYAPLLHVVLSGGTGNAKSRINIMGPAKLHKLVFLFIAHSCKLLLLSRLDTMRLTTLNSLAVVLFRINVVSAGLTSLYIGCFNTTLIKAQTSAQNSISAPTIQGSRSACQVGSRMKSWKAVELS